VEAGEKKKDVAAALGVSASSVSLWTKEHTAESRPKPFNGPQVTRLIHELENALGGLVSSLQFVDTSTTVLDADTATCLAPINESLRRLTRFVKELNRARDKHQTTTGADRGAQG